MLLLSRYPGTRGTLRGYPGSRPDPSPGGTWRTRRVSGVPPGSLAWGHVAHPEGIQGLARIPRPASVAPVLLFTRLSTVHPTEFSSPQSGTVHPNKYCSRAGTRVGTVHLSKCCSRAGTREGTVHLVEYCSCRVL